MEINRAFAFKPEPRLQIEPRLKLEERLQKKQPTTEEIPNSRFSQKKQPTTEEIPNSRFSQKKQPTTEEIPTPRFLPPAVSTDPVGEARGSTDVGELEKILKPLLSKVREELKHTFMQVAYNDSTLTRLDLSDRQLIQPEITCLAKALETNTTVTELDLRRCSINISGMKTIGKRMITRATTQKPPIMVNLGGNTLDQLLYSFKEITKKNQDNLLRRADDSNKWLCEMIIQGLDQNIIIDDKPLQEAYRYVKRGNSIFLTS
jgi:hypothetical protein